MHFDDPAGVIERLVAAVQRGKARETRIDELHGDPIADGRIEPGRRMNQYTAGIALQLDIGPAHGTPAGDRPLEQPAVWRLVIQATDPACRLFGLRRKGHPKQLKARQQENGSHGNTLPVPRDGRRLRRSAEGPIPGRR
jgi:hypothetical protein